MGRVLRIAGLATASILGLIAVAVVGLVVAVNRGWLDETIERMASQTLEREVELIGGIELRPGLQTALALGPVRIANPAWAIGEGAGDTLARVERVAVSVDLPSLLRGPIVLPEVTVDRPTAGLLRLADGRANWRAGDGTPPATEPTASDPPANERDGGDLTLPEIRRLRIAGVAVDYADRGTSREVEARLDELAGGFDTGGRAQIRGQGRLAEFPITLRLDGGPDGRGWQVSALEATLGENKVTGAGKIADLATLDGLEARLEADLPRLTALARAFGLTDRVIPDFLLTAEATRDAEANRLRVEASFGRDRLVLTATNSGSLATLDNLRLLIDAEGTNLGQFFPLLGMTEQPVPSYRLDADIASQPDGSTLLAIDAALGTTRLVTNGRIAERTAATAAEVDVEVEGQSPARLMALFGLPQIELPPYAVKAHVVRNGATVGVTNLDGRIGDSDIKGSATADLSRQPVAVIADLTSDLVDFDDLGGLIGAPPDPTETASPGQRREAARLEAADRLLPDTQIDPASWRKVDLDLRFRGNRVDAPNLPIDNLAAHITVRKGLITIDPLEATVAGGRFTTLGTLDGTGAPVRGEFDVRVARLQLKPFLARFGVADYGLGVFTGRAELAVAGNGLRQMAASADGRVALTMEGGKLDAILLEAAGLDITESLGVLFFDNDEDPGEEKVEVRCMIADLAIEQGVVRTQAFLIDTPDEKLTVEGRIDLGNETLDLLAHSFPRDASIGSARMPIRVAGPIRSPGVSPAPGGVENRTLGWILSPLAALVPFVELGAEDDRPCAGVADRVRQQAGSRG